MVRRRLFARYHLNDIQTGNDKEPQLECRGERAFQILEATKDAKIIQNFVATQLVVECQPLLPDIIRL